MNKLEKPIPVECLFNETDSSFDSPFLRSVSPETAATVARFHQSIPGYKPTPLIKLPALAQQLAVNSIMVKDESHRFNLNAFKVLGAGYAVARVLSNLTASEAEPLSFDTLLLKEGTIDSVTFITATDGNHGRAVAWTANKLGCNSVVLMPRGSSQARVKAIQQTGADVSVTDGTYDETVKLAEKAAKEKHWILLQDTAWNGYEDIPTFIMQGYFTILSEYILQEQEVWPTHVFVQAGVGSLAASMLTFLCRCTKKPRPVFIVVEPVAAACYFQSLKAGDGRPHSVSGDLQTIMAGLACGRPSTTGWRILKSGADAFITGDDDVARRGMRLLANPVGGDKAIISGESGAVTAGIVCEILTGSRYRSLQETLHIDENSNILLISTEGDTDPEQYQKIISSRD